MDKIVLGADIAAQKIDLCLRLGSRILSSFKNVSNHEGGFKELVVWVDKYLTKHGRTRQELHVVMEATGSYHERLAYYLNAQGYICHVVLASRAQKFLKSLSEHKNDKIDAQNLARFGVERTLEVWTPPSEGMVRLRQLTRLREAFAQQSTVIKNQLHALSSGYHTEEFVKKTYESQLESLQNAIKSIDEEIAKVVESDSEIHQNVAHMTSITGVGILTAVTLIAETDNFRLIESRSQLVCYAGYDIIQRESGKTVKGKPRMSKVGNAHIRRVLFMAASSAIQHNIACKDLYERVLKRNGNIKMKAHVAVQRKLLVLMYALVKNNTKYNLEKHLKDSNLSGRLGEEKYAKGQRGEKTGKLPNETKPNIEEKPKKAQEQVVEIGES